MRKREKLQRDLNRVSEKKERDKLQTEKDGWSKNKGKGRNYKESSR
jgi:hypothetical protein